MPFQILGQSAGYSATSASNSNSWSKWFYASYSTLIGYNVGQGTIGSIGSNNIIIGTNIGLSAGTTNSINLGGVLFANTHSTTSGNPSISAQTNGRMVLT
jgi:hypothetical protein